MVTMNFDPALEAQLAFQRCRAHEELGDRWEEAEELEATFSSSAGPEASRAYHALVTLGQAYPQASAYQEFLVYISWQQVTERTVKEYFALGTRLCDQFLAHNGQDVTDRSRDQVHTLRRSFREGLGLSDENELEAEFRRDTPKGGD